MQTLLYNTNLNKGSDSISKTAAVSKSLLMKQVCVKARLLYFSYEGTDVGLTPHSPCFTLPPALSQSQHAVRVGCLPATEGTTNALSARTHACHTFIHAYREVKPAESQAEMLSDKKLIRDG